jgi:hypothetical protein
MKEYGMKKRIKTKKLKVIDLTMRLKKHLNKIKLDVSRLKLSINNLIYL